MSTPAPREIPVRHVAAVLVGNALEFFDFTSYAFFAVYIGNAFFPSAHGSQSLLYSLATFGAGFLTRPLGGLVLAPLGDRFGRKPMLVVTFTLVGLATLGLALTPSYAQIGIAAPLLAIGFRLLQGFAVGGEVGPTASFLIESAPLKHRGLYGSLFYTTADFAVLVAGLIGVGLANTLDASAMQAWGWRVPFFIGAAIVPFGLLLRGTLPETLHAPRGSAPRAPTKITRALVTVIVIAFVIMATGTTLTYTRLYLTTYAIHTLGMSSAVAFGATLTTGIVCLFFEPFGGWLSDRIGRKPVMIGGGIALLVLVWPVFLLMTHFRTGLALCASAAALAVMGSFYTPPGMAWFAESLPRSLRSGIFGISYAFAIGVFGGSAQFIVTWLIDVMHNPLAPAFYLGGSVAIGLGALFAMRESAPIKTGISAEAE